MSVDDKPELEMEADETQEVLNAEGIFRRTRQTNSTYVERKLYQNQR